MGQTLGRAAEWTSAKEGSKGKLEYTATNEMILNEIIKYTESFTSSHQPESEVPFKQPLTWETQLKPTDFQSGEYITTDGNVESDKKSKDKVPMLTLKNKDMKDERYDLSVNSLEFVIKALNIAGGDRKLAETRACLEANQDPVAKMLGDRFATIEGPDNAQYRYFEEIMRAKPKGGEEQTEDGDETADKMAVLRMLIAFKEFDTELLGKAVSVVSTEVRLTPAEVNRQVELLKKFCGNDDEKHVCKSVTFPEPYTHRFSNDCRAYPVRQAHGDISYIEVTPHDTDVFYVTASTSGYYINKGFSADSKELIYEKNSESFKDLFSLIRQQSPKFNELIDKQDFFKLHESEKEKQHDMMDELDNKAPDGGHEQNTARSHHGKNQEEEKKKQADRKKKEQDKKKKLEPSLKWRNLDVEEDKEIEKKDKEKEKKKIKSSSKRRKESSQQGMAGSDDDEVFEESSSESEEEEETPDRRNEASSDLPSEYWQIQKLVKYLKGGNQTATIIALCAMQDFNLAQETCQLAIRDVGGLEVLINLLDTGEIKCKIGSLMILKEISKNTQIRRAIADLGGLQTMVKILRDSHKELKCLAAETIANVAKFRRARRTVRQHGGIKKLVGLLDCAGSLNSVTTKEQEMDVEVARCGALALWSCSKSTRNKQSMRNAGAIPLLARLLKSPHENMLIPVVGTLQECATEPSYRLAIRTEGMVEDLVNNLKSENQELQMHCASAIFKCAEEKETRDLVRQYGGLDPLVSLLNNTENKELLAAATGAIWKCSISPENVVRFQELKAIDLLVQLLNNQPEEVLVNVVGALAELAKDPPNRLTIRKAGGIPPLVNLLTGTNQALLVNVTKAVGQCAQESDNMVVIDKLDGVRLLWSLLKNPNHEVQASAAWAICPCIENAKPAEEEDDIPEPTPSKTPQTPIEEPETPRMQCLVQFTVTHRDRPPSPHDGDTTPSEKEAPKPPKKTNEYQDAGEMVRSFVGGLELIVSLLKSEDKEVLASVCAAIANIASDEENLAVITDHGVVPMLAKLTNTTDDRLRRHLAEAIARCCNWGNNRVAFGEAGAVAPLVRYLKSTDTAVHRSTAKSLFQLSKDPDNCITMHESGVVKPLMEMVGSQDDILQEAAAGCIANIRRLALANEKARNN